MRPRFHSLVCLPPVLALATWATSAQATLTLEALQPDFVFALAPDGSNVNWVIAADNNPFAVGTVILDSGGHWALVINDFNANPGQLALSGAGSSTTQVGSFLVGASVEVSNSPGVLGPPTVAQLQTQSFLVTNTDTVAHTQYVMVGDTDYSIPLGPIHALSLAQGSGLGSGGSIRVQTWDDQGNTLFGGTAFFPTVGPVTQVQDSGNIAVLNGVPYFDYGSKAVYMTEPYSKTIEFDITLNPGGSLSQRQNTFTNTAVPEPTTFVGAIVGLAGVALVARLRRKAS